MNIMNLEQQVCSLDLAKRLEKLGFRGPTHFQWRVNWIAGDGGIEKEEAVLVSGENYETKGDSEDGLSTMGTYLVWAPTVAELGEMLWNAFEKHGWDLLYKAYGEVFNFKGTQRIGDLGIINLMRKPDMAAKILIYLLENKLITL